MKRKIIQIANSTHLVSLPKKWCVKYGVKKGEEIEVRENGNVLCISNDKALTVDQITLNVSELTPRLVDRLLARSYQKGYDKLTLKFRTNDQLVAIREKVKELLGFEIMEVSKDLCTLQTISSKLEINFDLALRKAFMFVLNMADVCLESYEKGDKKSLHELYHKDFDVNKFCYYCLRHINKEQSGSFGTYILYYLIETLEDVGDYYKELATLLENDSQKKDLIKAIKMTNDVFKLGYEFFYAPDGKKAVEAINAYNEAFANIRNTYSKLKQPDELKALAITENILKLVYHYPTMRLDTIKELKESNIGVLL